MPMHEDFRWIGPLIRNSPHICGFNNEGIGYPIVDFTELNAFVVCDCMGGVWVGVLTRKLIKQKISQWLKVPLEIIDLLSRLF